MPQAQLFRLEAEVRCADGDCGTLRTLVIRPGDDAVTHLVVEPAHGEGPGKIVPLGLVDTGGADTGGAGTAKGELRLRCTRAEFERLNSAEATYFPGDEGYENTVGLEPDALWPYYATPGPMMPGTVPPGAIPEPVTVDTVSDQLPGEDQVYRGDHVHAADGDIGHVLGFVVEAGSGRVVSVLLREGHLLGRRTVLIPRSAVAEVSADGFRLSITREQVRHLPPADAEHLPAQLQAGGVTGRRGYRPAAISASAASALSPATR